MEEEEQVVVVPKAIASFGRWLGWMERSSGILRNQKATSSYLNYNRGWFGSGSFQVLVVSFVVGMGMGFGNQGFAQVRISQAYGGGGNTGATLKNDFIELYNAGASTVSLSGWSIQYVSATASTGSYTITTLSGSIGPKKYYLIKQAAGVGGTQDLPTPDATGTIAMTATGFRLALVSNTTPLAVTSSANAVGIVDFVGASSTALTYEGTGPAPATGSRPAGRSRPSGRDFFHEMRPLSNANRFFR